MRSAVAFPMPRFDPVTTATLPSSRMHRSATRRGGRHAQALQDEPDLLTLVSRQVAERWAHRPGGMAEELHSDLHDGHLEAPPALAEVVERSNDALVELCEPAVVRGTGETVELERGLGPEARERRGEGLRPRREVRTDHVVARAGEPDEPLRAEALAHVLAQPLEQAHVAAAVLERDEVGDLAGEPLQKGGRDRDAVARVDLDAERRGLRDLAVVADEAVGGRLRVVGRQHEDPVGAVALRLARELSRDARSETDARDDRDPAGSRLDAGAHDRGALVPRQAEQISGTAPRDERVHAAAREPARVRVDRGEVDRAVVGVRRDREREHAAEERSQGSRGRRREDPRHRRTRTTMFVGFTKRSAASSSTRLVAMYTTAIASICWLGRMPGAKAA